MDHSGLFADLDSLTSLTNCGTINNSFNDCSSLPSLNNFKYQQTNLSSNIYQQPLPHENQAKASNLPQTQININNCNNNIFFSHDDGLFDTNTSSQCASSTIAPSNTSNNPAKSNFIGYVRKDLAPNGGGLTVINNVNTNIVNNIQNPTNFVNGSDIYSSGSGGVVGAATDQYHQISKSGETIINFTNGHNNSMPADAVSATSQNYFGNYQSTYDTSTNQSTTQSSMGTTGGGYHAGHHQSSLSQPMANGTYHHPGNSNQIHIDHNTPSVSDLFSDYQEPLSTAKIINNFESKNPLKYQTQTVSQQPPPPPTRYNAQYGHLPHPQHYPPSLYQTQPKMPSYEHYPRLTRSSYPSQHYPSVPQSSHAIDNYNRHNHVPQYHHLTPHPPPPNGYPNYYGQSYSAPLPYSSYPQMPYKTPTSYSKSDFAYQPAPKKDFYPSESPYYQPQPQPPPQQPHHPYSYEDLSSCAVKKSSSRSKVGSELYNQVAQPPIYPDHHAMTHQSVMRAPPNYQPMPKPMHYPMQSEMPPANHYHNFGYQHPPKMPQKMPQVKQFKSYSHYDQLPHHSHYVHPQYQTMQAKHPEKLKIYDVEDQIAGSKIPKAHQYPFDPLQAYYQHHYMPTRSVVNDNDPKNSMAGINLSLRDFLSTWNEIDEDEEARPPLNEISDHMERSIMREYNPMFVQKAVAENFEVPAPVKQSEVDISEGSEKLYVLESIDVPLSELNKYKHLSVINKLPENVVINENDMKYEEIEMVREKLYKSEFELELEAFQEQKPAKRFDEDLIKVETPKVIEEVEVEKPKEVVEVKKPEAKPVKVRTPKKLKVKVLKTKVRIAKRVKKYSLNQHTSSVQTLRSTCVDFLNTSCYRNFAREQISLIDKRTKKRILQDIKKKLNFDGMKKRSPIINQKSNHSVRINSLKEICGKRLLELDDEQFECPTLQELCKRALTDMDFNVVENEYLYSPLTLKEMCESFIYAHPETFLIEEVSNVPKLQDLCKNILSETNIFINLEDEVFQQDEEVYIVEESSGNVGELFESENLDSFEKSEILRKIQRVAAIDDDDEIIRAIGALHRENDDESISNNNDNGVSNRNIANGFDGAVKLDSEMSFMAFMDDDLMHSVQHEEIIGERARATAKIVEILRHKHLNRGDERRTAKCIKKIVNKSLKYQRAQRYHNAKRSEHIEGLKEQARAAFSKRKEEAQHCDSPQESQSDAKDDNTEAQLRQIFSREASSTEADASDGSEDAQAERNLPELPAVIPSINEYKIDRKGDDGADMICDAAKKRKLTFDESLLSLDKIRREDPPRRHSSSHHRRHHRSSGSSHNHSSRRSSHHNSSRDFYRNDQPKHSEAKRLVIPSYKLYDKDLDVKLKVRPFVRIEREERLEGLAKQYN